MFLSRNACFIPFYDNFCIQANCSNPNGQTSLRSKYCFIHHPSWGAKSVAPHQRRKAYMTYTIQGLCSEVMPQLWDYQNNWTLTWCSFTVIEKLHVFWILQLHAFGDDVLHCLWITLKLHKEWGLDLQRIKFMGLINSEQSLLCCNPASRLTTKCVDV